MEAMATTDVAFSDRFEIANHDADQLLFNQPTMPCF